MTKLFEVLCVQYFSVLVLGTPCPVCFRCSSSPTHLIEINGLLYGLIILNLELHKTEIDVSRCRFPPLTGIVYKKILKIWAKVTNHNNRTNNQTVIVETAHVFVTLEMYLVRIVHRASNLLRHSSQGYSKDRAGSFVENSLKMMCSKFEQKCWEISLKRSVDFIIHTGSKPLNIYTQLCLYFGEITKLQHVQLIY